MLIEEQPRILGTARTAGSQPTVRIPIRTKIAVPYLVLAVLLALGVSLLVSQIVFDTLDDRFSNQLAESGKLAAESLVQQEKKLLETLRLLANTSGIPEAVKSGDASRLREISFGVILNNQTEAVELLDRQGALVFSARHAPGARAEEYNFTQGGQFFQDLEFVRKVLAHQADTLGDKYDGIIHAEWGNYLYVSGPVLGTDGDLVGVILVGKSLSSLIRSIREETLAQVTLYDMDGRILVTTFSAEIDLAPELAADILATQDQSSLKRSLSYIRDRQNASIDYGEILGPWEGRGDADFGVIGSALAKSFLVKSSNWTRVQIFILLFLALSLILVLGILVSGYITKPLLRLVGASSRVAGGDLQVQVETNSQDELAILSASFNSMVTSLNQSKMEILEAYDRTLEGWSNALELRDKETEGHTRRVTNLTVDLARRMGFSGEDLANIRRGSLLHDIGKMGIPDAILHKQAALNEEEWKIMRRHPMLAADLLEKIQYLHPASKIPYNHHEHWDGSGYPHGLRGEEIPLEARIFTIVDVWDAITSDRPYRKSMSHEEAVKVIRSSRGRLFDPRVTDEFLRLIGEA